MAAPVDRMRLGAVARQDGMRTVRRAEPGSYGPLVLSASVTGQSLDCAIWGPSATPRQEVESALVALLGWTGQLDEPQHLRPLVAGHDLLRRLLAHLGEVRIGRVPRVFEALGRSVVHQLVQRTEAVRSVAQLSARFGEQAPGGLVTWPTAQRIATLPAWELRRCGISLRGVRALHAAATEHARLEGATGNMTALDARLRSLPGVGTWTSAETRLALGDPDAVSVGDYNLHAIVTYGLARVDPRNSSDEMMLELLAPFAPQRGRVVTLIGRAMRQGVLERPPRRAPHARLSQHRYW